MPRPGQIYLDWNATTIPAPEVVAAMGKLQTTAWGNPASVHSIGRLARSVLEASREALADILAIEPRDVFFTSGGTEANNLALASAPGVVTSRIEHPSVVRVAEKLESSGIPVIWAPVEPSGRVSTEAVRQAVARLPPGSTIAVAAVNHETGVIQDVRALSQLSRQVGARLHVDAVQALGKVDAQTFLGADSIAVSAHKLRGPKGIGALAWKGAPPIPVLRGGSQERGVRPGTQDAVLAEGFRVAAQRAAHGPAKYRKIAPLRDRIEHALSGYVTVNGEGQRAPHVTNLSVHGWRGDELVAALDLEGVLISSGSACSAGTAEASPVIVAMLGEGRALSAIRVSLGDDTTEREVEAAIGRILRTLRTPERETSSNA